MSIWLSYHYELENKCQIMIYFSRHLMSDSANTKHLYNIYTMCNKCFVLAIDAWFEGSTLYNKCFVPPGDAWFEGPQDIHVY